MIFTIFGYPKTGKTTLFNLLTGKKEKVSKFATSTNKDLNKAIVEVPDKRIEQINKIFKKNLKYARIEYMDTGSLAYGEVKNSAFLDPLKVSDGLVHTVRGFSDPEIVHPAGSVDPMRDIESMENELILTDLITVENRLKTIELDLKKKKTRALENEKNLLEKIKNNLEEGKPIREIKLSENDDMMIRGFQLLSKKPIIHMVNIGEEDKQFNKQKNNFLIMSFYGKIEAEISELDEEEKKIFMEEYNIDKSIRERFIKDSYQLLNLISFFTIGDKEVKAWTIKQGSTAYEAAGKIHSDIQKGFIKAEVIYWEDLIKAGGIKESKDQALLKLEGKDYKVKDGDILQIRFGK